MDFSKTYKVGQDFPLSIYMKKDGMELGPESEREYPCTIIEVTKHKIVVEDENGRHITLGEPSKAH